MLKLPFSESFAINQAFGENKNGFYAADGLKGHTGIDYGCPTGTPVLSPCNGTVVAVSVDITKGEGVAIISDDKFQYEGQECLLDCVMWHLMDKSIIVKVGDKVVTGQLLGYSDNTGRSTGPHLHFSVLPIATDGSRKVLAGMGNGYNGCVDPTPFLESLIAPPRVLKMGMSGDDVKALQTKLGINADGIFGRHTKEAVIQFQIGHGLTGDGIVGPLTNEKLNAHI